MQVESKSKTSSLQLDLKPPDLLVIEDSDEDFDVFRRLLRQLSFTHPLHRCTNGEESLDFLYSSLAYPNSSLARCPKLILLDLNLPGTDGREVLEQIKQHNILKSIPVVIFTTSSNPKDIKSCYEKGVSGYIVKPINLKLLARSVETLLEYWFKIVALPLEC